jgi:tRNA threonylcarbamoyladenosine biosynthesis protein TsaB
MLLAIDTATSLTGIALYDGRGPLAECVWESGRNHTAQLLPQLDRLLGYAGVERGALRAVGVALGPGSWSGLRVGMSVAKGLALAGALALLGISTLEALAYQHARAGMPIYPLIHLGRNRFATAMFQFDSDPARREPDRTVTLDELCAEVEEQGLFCGDLDEGAVARIQRALGRRALFPRPAANLRRPAFLAELAWQRLVNGEGDDLVSLEPIYLGEAVKPRP